MTARAPLEARYAVSLCPDPEGPAWVAAAEWIGRCAARDAFVPQPVVPGMSASFFCALTEEPRRYGFHAMLRAPFRAGLGVTRKSLAKEMSSIAAARTAFRLPPLRVRLFEEILAIVPEGDASPAASLAAECVMRLDRLRAPLSSEEIRARASLGLNARQHGLLLRWGHPYVMDEFRLHYPLSGQLTPFDEEIAERLAAQASEHFRFAFDALRWIDRIALFEQRAPGAPFRLVDMAPLAAASRLVYVVVEPAAERALRWARERLAGDDRIVFATRVPRAPEAGNTVVTTGPAGNVPRLRRQHPDIEVVHVATDPSIEVAGNALVAAIRGRVLPQN